MSVLTELTIPVTPAGGNVVYSPLGGDGFNAPISCYLVNGVSVSGDASGGTAQVKITMDDRYQSLIATVDAKVTSQASAAQTRITIATEGPWSLGVTKLSTLDPLGTGHVNWSPPPIFDALTLNALWDNIDATEDYKLTAIIYNFNKRASELVPLSVLLASLPRSQTLF